MKERKSIAHDLPATRTVQTFGCAVRRAPAQKRMIDSFCLLSLWLSLPLVIWLSSGWIGLLGHWQALAGFACLLEKFRRSPQPALQPIPAVTRDE